MINIIEVFKPESLSQTPAPDGPYFYKITVSISNPPNDVADWWKTTYGGGTDYNSTRKIVGAFWDAEFEYNEKTSLADCIAEERSFYFDQSPNPQILYVHVDHTLRPLDTNTILYAGFGVGYSSDTGVYIDDIPYDPLVNSIVPFKLEVDPISIGKPQTLSGSVTFDNSDGTFDSTESWYGDKVKTYLYDLVNDPIRIGYGNVGNEGFSFEEFRIDVKDAREFDDVKIILDKWDTTLLEAGHSKIGKPIPLGFGENLGVEGVNVIGSATGYKKFKGISECLTVDAAYVLDDEVWTSVTVYSGSTDGTLSIANADVLDANDKLLKVKIDYTCDYENIADRIVYLNLTYLGTVYDSTNYNLTCWETERFAFSECGGLIKKDTNLFKLIAEWQAEQRWLFFYWRDKNARRNIKIDNPNRTPRYNILAEDIESFDRAGERDSDTFASSLEILYSYDHSDKTYLSYINDDYRDSVFRTFRKYKDLKGDDGKKTVITSETEAMYASQIRMEDWKDVHDTFTIQISREDFPDTDILDILEVDLAIPEDMRVLGSGRTYFGEQRVKVISLAYVDNDFIELVVRVQAFSVVIAGIGGYMSTTVINNTRISANDTLPDTANNGFLVYNEDASAHDVTYGAFTKTLEADETGFFLYDGTDWHILAVWTSTGVNAVTQAWVEAQGYLTSGVPETGFIGMWSTASPPTGWILAEGDTIGDTGSGATYAGSEYEDLFDLYNVAGLWGNPGSAVFATGGTVLAPDFRNIPPFGANASTRSVDSVTQDASPLGVSHADQGQQITGEIAASDGARGIATTGGVSGAFSLGSATGGSVDTSSSPTWNNVLFDSADSADARTATTTRNAGLGVTFIIKI